MDDEIEKQGCERCHQFFLPGELKITGEDSTLCEKCIDEMSEAKP